MRTPVERLAGWVKIDALMPPGAILNGDYVGPGNVLDLPGFPGSVQLVGVTTRGVTLRTAGEEVRIPRRGAE